jgi:hypothetical protein
MCTVWKITGSQNKSAKTTPREDYDSGGHLEDLDSMDSVITRYRKHSAASKSRRWNSVTHVFNTGKIMLQTLDAEHLLIQSTQASIL